MSTAVTLWILRENYRNLAEKEEAGVADKLSELIDAIKNCNSEAKDINARLSTNEELRKIFPSIPRTP